MTDEIDTPVFLAIDPSTSENVEFVTVDEDDVERWVDSVDGRFYERRYPVGSNYVDELLREDRAIEGDLEVTDG